MWTHVGATSESIEGDGLSTRCCDCCALGNGLLNWKLASIMMSVDLHESGWFGRMFDEGVRRVADCAVFVEGNNVVVVQHVQD